MTASTDGEVLWWDIRKLGEPTETLTLKERGGETILGAVCMEYNPAAGPTKFMVGTESGTIISCNRKAKNPQDRVGAAYPGAAPLILLIRIGIIHPEYGVQVQPLLDPACSCLTSPRGEYG